MYSTFYIASVIGYLAIARAVANKPPEILFPALFLPLIFITILYFILKANKEDNKPLFKTSIVSMLVFLVTSFFMLFVLNHSIEKVNKKYYDVIHSKNENKDSEMKKLHNLLEQYNENCKKQ